jgi:hypothetical protein
VRWPCWLALACSVPMLLGNLVPRVTWCSCPLARLRVVVVMADRLALATRTATARRPGACSACGVPIAIGQAVVRLVNPAGYCHESCVPVIAADCEA